MTLKAEKYEIKEVSNNIIGLDVYQLGKCINLPAVATDRDSSRVCINMYSHYITILHNM